MRFPCIARDAAGRGFSVLLAERGDLGGAKEPDGLGADFGGGFTERELEWLRTCLVCTSTRRSGRRWRLAWSGSSPITWPKPPWVG